MARKNVCFILYSLKNLYSSFLKIEQSKQKHALLIEKDVFNFSLEPFKGLFFVGYRNPIHPNSRKTLSSIFKR